jgi:hypothetical protein
MAATFERLEQREKALEEKIERENTEKQERDRLIAELRRCDREVEQLHHAFDDIRGMEATNPYRQGFVDYFYDDTVQQVFWEALKPREQAEHEYFELIKRKVI